MADKKVFYFVIVKEGAVTFGMKTYVVGDSFKVDFETKKILEKNKKLKGKIKIQTTDPAAKSALNKTSKDEDESED